jgi:uncharacterized protein YndB with AHSA1/START domain
MADERMHVETTDRELIFTRVFDAPRELVFETFSDCEHLRNWWGPREWPLSTCDMDFREGGSWTYCMKGPEDQLACSKAVYGRIVTPELIEYQDYFLDESGEVNEELPNGLMTLQFAVQGEGTKITGRAQYPGPTDLQTVLEMGIVEGMTETMDRLEELLARIQ